MLNMYTDARQGIVFFSSFADVPSLDPWALFADNFKLFCHSAVTVGVDGVIEGQVSPPTAHILAVIRLTNCGFVSRAGPTTKMIDDG